MTMSKLSPILLLSLLLCGAAFAGGWSTQELAAALETPARSDADRARDADRKPADVLVFAGVEPGMTVMDVMAASGWYTEVLSVAVGPEGRVYAENPAWLLNAMNGAPSKALTTRLADGRLPNVVRADEGLDSASIPAGSVDLALTALNFHDTYFMGGEDAAVGQLEQVFAALKPGGVFILIDHAGNAGLDNAKLHRIPQETVVQLAKDAGFEVAAEGDMLRHAEDDRTQMVFGKGIRGKTDRFVLKLRKPA
jgi:predicted methyltransferase